MSPPIAIADEAHGLAFAVVASSTVPLLLLDAEFSVLEVSASFCRTFDLERTDVLSRKLFDLGAGEWDTRQLRSLLQASLAGTASVDAYEMDIRIGDWDPHCLIVTPQKLDYDHQGPPRFLLTIADVTEARSADTFRDDLVREKGILLQELHHRIANSLQIIASVLLQSARKMNTDESRLHFHAAHNRVLSIAAVQQHLAASRLGDVELGSYFKQLCDSLSASMIQNPDRVRITVETDHSVVKADTSVSLGLMVTELVINALKYAFPADRAGTIVVDYRTHGADWTLSVKDNGVGMSAKPPKPGLGTSIVEALAKQLGARIDVVNARPGTAVSVVRDAGSAGRLVRAV